MSDLMKKVLAAKLQSRKDLAALSFEEKLRLVERMRERSLLLAENQLRFRKRDGKAGGLAEVSSA